MRHLREALQTPRPHRNPPMTTSYPDIMTQDDLWAQLRAADQKLADEREAHHRELREADQKLADAYNHANALHFAQLNENAQRTIEERGHFVSRETFDPFQKQVLNHIATTSGASKSNDRTFSMVIAVISVVIAIAAIVVAVTSSGTP